MLRCGLLFIGGTTLAVIIATACGDILDRLFPSGGIIIFAVYFVIHVAALAGALAATIRYS
jgi:hypothetical protein